MTEEQREKAFPIHIELGNEMSSIGFDGKKSGKPQKSTIYPTAYISGVEGLEKIPDEGCMLVHFKRNGLTVRKDGNGKSTASVELELHTICLEDEADEDVDDIVDSLYKKATNKSEDSEESEDED